MTRNGANSAVTSLNESYAYCRQLARRTGRNFYFSFLTLPADRFRSMCALYAFMRLTDDLGDDETRPLPERAAALEAWRGQVSAALAGQTAGHLLFPALHDLVTRHAIPPEHLFAVIEGVQMDLVGTRFQTFAELERYCYHVAGAVGLCCIHVWGFHDAAALPAAVACGTAFQLTNILRDLKEDAAMGRCYLPQEDLERFGYTEADIIRGCQDERFTRLMAFEVDRARGFYQTANELFEHLEPCGRPILKVMLQIYGGLLNKIEARHYDVFSSRVRLSTWRKLCCTARGILHQRWLGLTQPRASVPLP